MWILSRAQLTDTCSKLKMKKQINLHVSKVKNKYSMTSFWCFYCWLWPWLAYQYSVSTFNFEQVFVSRVWKTSQCSENTKSDILARSLRSEHVNHFDQKVSYPQSVDILVLYIKSNFLRLHCGTIMLQAKSELKFWCNISTNLSNCKNWFCSRKKTLLVQGRKIRNIGVEQKNFELDKKFWKMLRDFSNFEHPDICSNLGKNCLISFRDSNKKLI